ETGGGAAGHDVTELIARAHHVQAGALPLTDGDVGVVDDGRILHIAEAAIDRHAHLNVLRAGDVVVGHEDIGKPAAGEPGVTRQALQPAGTPVGPITNEWPKRSVRMLGSAVLLLPCSSRLGLKVAPLGLAASAGPPMAKGSAPSPAATRTPTSRRRIRIFMPSSSFARKLT